MLWLPHTTLGKWSVALASGFASLALFTDIVTVGIFRQSGGNNPLDNLFISLPMIVGFLCALAAAATGVAAFVTEREHAFLTMVSAALGGVVTVFLAAELVVPH